MVISNIPVTMIRSSDGPRPIPVIGMGTASSKESGDEVTVGIIEAMKVGYRHFDTAALYKTEKALGEAIKEALKLGLIKCREELFITTKLWCNSADGHLVLPAINQSLRNLGLEYVDLYLIHWPLKLNQEEIKIPIPKECIFPINIRDVWKAMEECQNLGLTKSIGVEMNPLWQQKKLKEFCKKNDILVTGYSPLGASGNKCSSTHCQLQRKDSCSDFSKMDI